MNVDHVHPKREAGDNNMDQSRPPARPVYRSRARRDCNERALVLQAAGIEHEILNAEGEHVLVVPAGDADRAAAELDEYARESHDSSPRSAPLPARDDGWYGVFAYATVLLLIAILKDRHALGVDWLDVGRTNAGLVRQGGWWRTVTALTLHMDVVHVAANLAFGALFGLFTGRLLGSGLAWAGILVAGALGNAMNACVQPAGHSAVGASTAVFGSLGILASYSWKQRRALERGWLRRWTPVLGGVLLLAYTGFGGERTDVIAHVTGFISGLLLGVLYASIGRRIAVRPRAQLVFGFAALALVVLCWLLALWAQV